LFFGEFPLGGPYIISRPLSQNPAVWGGGGRRGEEEESVFNARNKNASANIIYCIIRHECIRI